MPSPDGTAIAYAVAGIAPARTSALWIMDTDGQNQHQLLQAAEGRLDVAGSWSPDSKQLAFTRCDIHAYRGPAAEDDSAIYAISATAPICASSPARVCYRTGHPTASTSSS